MKMAQGLKVFPLLMLLNLVPEASYAILTTTTPTPAGTYSPLPGGAPIPSVAIPAQSVSQSTTQTTSSTVQSTPTTASTVLPSGPPAPGATYAPPGTVGAGLPPIPAGAQLTTGPATSTTTTITEKKELAQSATVEEETLIPPIAAPVTYRQIAELMIYESNLIHGECACPYSPDRIGGQCGSESQYYKPHSDKLYCYYSDIKNNDIHFYWLKNGIGVTDF